MLKEQQRQKLEEINQVTQTSLFPISVSNGTSRGFECNVPLMSTHTLDLALALFLNVRLTLHYGIDDSMQIDLTVSVAM